VKDAKVSLVRDGANIQETASDDFGDFRFGGLPANSGAYRIEVQHALGSASCNCELIESVYLGELTVSAGDTAKDVVSQ
jgi:hypothetical protein